MPELLFCCLPDVRVKLLIHGDGGVVAVLVHPNYPPLLVSLRDGSVLEC